MSSPTHRAAVDAAWSAYGDDRRIVRVEEVSADVSTNRVYRMYLDDYEGAWPFSWYSQAQYGWDAALYPYTKNVQIFACPSNPQLPEERKGYVALGIGGMTRSYAMNATVSTDQRPNPTYEASIPEPASTIMMLETTDWNYKHTRYPDHETYVANRNDVCQHVPFTIHQGGSNYLFADTHARWARVE